MPPTSQENVIKHTIGLCLGIILAACTPELPVEPPPAASIRAPTRAVPSPSPLPELALEIDEWHWVQAQGGQWQLIGSFINQEAFAIEEVALQLHLPATDTADELILTSPTIPTHIPPASDASFHFSLPGDRAPADYPLQWAGREAERAATAEVLVKISAWHKASGGGWFGYGEIENPSNHLLHTRAVQMILFDVRGMPIGVARSDEILPGLAPGGTVPFRVQTAASPSPHSWVSFVDARLAVSPSTPPLEVRPDFHVQLTQQGQFYFIGSILNQGVTPWWLDLNIVFRYQGEVIGMGSLSPPFSLTPDEEIAFVLEPFQAISYQELLEASAEEIEVRTHIDPWGSLPSLDERISLPATIARIEQIGSRLYLSGQILNDQTSELSSATAYFRVFDVRGNILSAGWSAPIHRMDSGESHEFSLNLPLPANLDLSLAEFDLRGFATP